MALRLTVSNSERATFLMCRKRWWFEYVELLRPVIRARALTWGGVFHGGIEAGYRAAFSGAAPSVALAKEAAQQAIALLADGVRDSLIEAQRTGAIGEEEADQRLADVGEMRSVGAWAVAHFFERTESDLHRLIPLAFELPLVFPVPDKLGRPSHLWNEGQTDAVWWDPQSKQVLVDDLKTMDTDPMSTGIERRIQLDPQMSGYLAGVRHKLYTGKLGGDIADPLTLARGVRGWCRYNLLRRSMPHEPHINKNGMVSTAKIDTTGEVYAAALARQEVERKLPINGDQRELLLKLGARTDRYFARHEFVRSAADEDAWRSDLWADSKAMRAAQRDSSLCTRNPGACTPANALPCVYRAPCLQDAPEARALFRVANDRHEEIKRDGQAKSEGSQGRKVGGRQASSEGQQASEAAEATQGARAGEGRQGVQGRGQEPYPF